MNSFRSRLTDQFDAYGAGWFYGLHALVMTILAIGLVLWLLRSADKAESSAKASQVELT